MISIHVLKRALREVEMESIELNRISFSKCASSTVCSEHTPYECARWYTSDKAGKQTMDTCSNEQQSFGAAISTLGQTVEAHKAIVWEIFHREEGVSFPLRPPSLPQQARDGSPDEILGKSTLARMAKVLMMAVDRRLRLVVP